VTPRRTRCRASRCTASAFARHRDRRAQLVFARDAEVAHYTIAAPGIEAESPVRRRRARDAAGACDLHAAMKAGDAPAEFGAILDVHWMILSDPTLAETRAGSSPSSAATRNGR